jgi:transposase InsO family protein
MIKVDLSPETITISGDKFTSGDFTDILKAANIQISMDGKG